MKLFLWLILTQWSFCASEGNFLSGLSSEMDRAALDVMEANFPHSRNVRSNHGQYQFGKNLKDLQKILLDKIEGIQKIEMGNPTDLSVFSMAENQASNRYEDYSQMRIAVAENFHDQPNCSSFVKIYSYKTDSFKLEVKLTEHAPYRLEHFTIYNSDGKFINNFLAVGGFLPNQKIRSPYTQLSIYEQGNQWIRVFQMSMAVTALRFVSTQNADMLIVAEKISEFTCFVTSLRYDLYNKKFVLHDRFPVAKVTDIEVVKYGKDYYLLLAVYQDYFGNLQATSLIYKYNSIDRKFRPYSSFHTIGVSDLNVFTYESKVYVIAAYEASGHKDNKKFGIPSVIFRVQEPFILKPVATISTVAARQTTTVILPSCTSKILIIAIDNSDNIDQMSLHVFDARAEKVTNQPVSFYKSSSHNGKPNPSKLATYFIGKRLFVLLATANNKVDNLLEIKYEIEDTGNPLQKLIESTKLELDKTESSLRSMENFIVNGYKTLKDAVIAKNEQSLNGTKGFIGNVFIANLTANSVIIENGSMLYETNSTRSKANLKKFESEIEVDDLKSEFDQQESQKKVSKQRMSESLFLNAEYKINGSYKFHTLTLNSDSHFGTVMVSKVNDIAVDFLIGDTVLQNESDVISGRKTFDAGLVVGNIDVVGKINKVDVSHDLVTIHNDQLIKSSKIESDDWGFNDSLYLGGSLNSINITNEFVSVKKHEKLTGKKSFASNLEAGNVTVGLLDDVAVDRFTNDVLTKNNSKKVTGIKTFKESLPILEDVFVTGYVKNINLKQLKSEVFRLNNSISDRGKGSLAFALPVEILGNLSVDGKINGLEFSRDLVLTSANQTVKGRKTFSSGCSVKGDVTVNGLIDGLQSDDFFLMSLDQAATGMKIFANSLDLNGNIILRKGNTIGNVRLADLSEDAVLISRDQNLTGSYKLSEINVDDALVIVDGKVQGKPLSFYQRVFQNAVLLDSDQSITATETFVNHITVNGNLDVTKKLNKLSFPYDYLHNMNDQNISSILRFNGDMRLNNGIEAPKMGMAEVWSVIVTMDKDGTILGRKTFVDDMTVVGDIVSENDAKGTELFKSLFLKNGDQSVQRSAKAFETAVVFGGVNAFEDVSVDNTVDDVDISDLNSKTSVDGKSVIVVEERIFDGTVEVGKMNIKTVNNVSLEELLKDIVTLTGNQNIQDFKSFDRMAIRGNLITNATIDDVAIANLSSNVVTVMDDFTVNGALRFDNILLKDLEVGGFIHEKELSYMHRNILLRSEDTKGIANLTVSGNLKASQNIDCKTINDFQPSLDFVVKQKHQTIKGIKEFSNGALVKGNMATEGPINRLSLMKLKEEAVTKYTSQVIGGIKTINRVISRSNVMVDNHVDGVSLSWLEDNVAYINRNCSMKGPFVFKNKCFINGSLNVNGQANQIDLAATFADAVTLLEKDTVEGQKEFPSDITVVKDMHVEQSAEIEGLVNSVNISLLYQDVLQTDGRQVTNGVKKFAKSVHCLNKLQLVGLVNGIDIGTDVVSSQRNQEIFGMKSFDEGLNAIGNMDVSKFSDGYDLSLISEDTVLKAKTGMQHVTGMKTIKKRTVFMQSMFAKGNVDGFNFSANEPITLSADQTLSKTVVFKSALKAESGIQANNSNLVKGLKSIESRRVLLNEDQEIQGNYQFKKNILVQETFKVHGQTSGGNLTLLQDSVDGLSAAVRQAESMQGNTCKMLNYMQRVFECVPVQIDYFEDYQIFDKLQTKEMYPFTIGDDRFIAVAVVLNKKGCTAAKILKFDVTHNNFKEYQTLPIKGADKFTFFVESGVEYLVAAADARPCGTTSTSVLYKLDRNTKMFVKQQILSSDNIVDVLSYNDGGGTRIVFVISSHREHFEFNLQILRKTTDVFKAVTTHNVGDYRMRCMASHRIEDLRFLALALSPRIGQFPETQYIFRITNDDFYVHQLLNEHNVHNIAFFNHLSSTYLVMSLQSGIGVPTGKKGYASLLTLSSSKYFHHLMSIPVENPIQVKTFRIKGQTFILVLHLHAGFTLFRFRENAVLEKLLKVPHIGLEQISRFDINGTNYLTMAANWPDKLTTHRVQRIPNSKILKLVTSGIDQRYIASKKAC